MRKLTIRRDKTIVGCLSKINIYIEDAETGDTVIQSIRCRLLGSLKNNEEKTFEIPENEASLFVIADKPSKNICNELYRLPESSEDIELAGKNRFEPSTGNAFRFYGNYSEQTAANRSKSRKKGLIILIIAVAVGFISGVVIMSLILINSPKQFKADDLSIELTGGFKEISQEGFTACYGTDDVAVFILRESLDNSTVKLSGYSINQYGKAVISNNNLPSDTKLKTEGELTYFEYSKSLEDGDYTYIAFIYKSNDAFWLINFATLTKNAEKYNGDIMKWAASVSIDD